MPHFDWYQATISVMPEMVGEVLLSKFPGVHGFEARPGKNNYHHMMLALDTDGETLATIQHGGPNGHPNAFASGERAHEFAGLVRDVFPGKHLVTRVDSAEDLHGHYLTLRDRCRMIAASSGVTGGHEWAVHDNAKGSTDYIGSKTSRVQHRIYEKGKQLLALAKDPASIRIDHVRLEVQWRPDKHARSIASTVTPEQVWGVSPWVRTIARDIIGSNPDRLRARPKLLSNFDRCHRAFLKQYGPHIRQLRARSSSWDEVGQLLCSALDGPTPGHP